MCGNKDLAEDLAQDSFIRAWQKIDSFKGNSAFSSWLYRLTSNVVIGHLRQQSKWKLIQFEDSKHEDKLGFTSMQTDRHDIEKAMQAMPDQARVILIMYEYLGYQHNEIAEITGMAVGTSKSHLHRARGYLKEAAA
jgi:RNA polymerase sigma-70 factor (ECF subfamily)